MRVMQCLLTVAAVSSFLACDQNSNAPSSAASNTTDFSTGFITSQPAQAFGLGGAVVKPIITVGDPIPGQESNPDPEQRVWAPIPDGLGAYQRGKNLVVFANHEIASSGVGGKFKYARVSRLVLDRALGVESGSYAITGKATGFLFQRLCSATFIGQDQGFGGWFFTGEESTGGEPGNPNSESGQGTQLAVSADGATTLKLPWLGRIAHENYIAVAGFRGKTVMIGTDDTSPTSTGTLQSELYMYVAASPAGVLNGSGKLYVFTSSAAVNSGALVSGVPITGEFREIPSPATFSPSGLQGKVNELGAFKFVRLEDVNSALSDNGEVEQDGDFQGSGGKPAIYFVDTGNATPSATCGNAPCDLAGSIYRMELNRSDPIHNATLVLLVRSRGAQIDWASPDNIAVSERSLMVQEDPAYAGFTRNPRIYNFRIRHDGSLSAPQAVAELPNTPPCIEPTGTCWESSGIIDASEWLGAGTWLFDVQAHSLAVPSQGLAGENGQLLSLRVRGS
ncbi:MAG TPA: alkaline phosphatase PhoX [Gemmatimonadales bacterium]|jgi:hypothetical protein|nr:alkaline phosphatase PhoX [Gemmatimonadales bacterium]